MARAAAGARKDRRERAAFSDCAPDVDASAVRLHDALHEREAEAGALMALGRRGFELLELDEEAMHVLGGDTDSVVLHVDAKLLVTVTRDPCADPRVLAGELDRVRKVIVEHL